MTPQPCAPRCLPGPPRRGAAIAIAIACAALLTSPALAGPGTPPPAQAPFALSLALEGPPPREGGGAQARLTITPQEGWVLKPTTPMHLALTVHGGVSLPRKTFTAADWSGAQGTGRSVAVALVAEAAGEARLDADMSFFLCSQTLCRRITATEQVVFHVGQREAVSEDGERAQGQ